MSPQKHLPDLFESAQVLHDGSVVAGVAAVDGLSGRGLPDADQVVLLQVEQGGGDIGLAIAWGRSKPPLLDALEGVAGILVGQQVLQNIASSNSFEVGTSIRLVQVSRGVLPLEPVP